MDLKATWMVSRVRATLSQQSSAIPSMVWWKHSRRRFQSDCQALGEAGRRSPVRRVPHSERANPGGGSQVRAGGASLWVSSGQTFSLEKFSMFADSRDLFPSHHSEETIQLVPVSKDR